MLKHTVLIKVRDDVPRHEVDTIFSYVHDLKNTLPGIMAFTYGESAKLVAGDGQFSHGYSLVFIDEDYFQDFLEHPKFQESQDRINGLLAHPDAMVMFNYSF